MSHAFFWGFLECCQFLKLLLKNSLCITGALVLKSEVKLLKSRNWHHDEKGKEKNLCKTIL